MASSIRIRYLGVPRSSQLVSAIEQQSRALAPFGEAIVDAQIALERWHCHHHRGAYYRVEIELWLAHKSIKISRESALGAPRAALDALIETVFASVTRALQSLVSDTDAGRHLPEHSVEERRRHALHAAP